MAKRPAKGPASNIPPRAAPSFSRLLQPGKGITGRLRAWFLSRVPATDHLLLTQRNVYILPTRPGWMMALTLVLMLIGSINYQLNLGYLLTFLLAGSAAAGIHICHANLRGLTLKLSPPQAGYAGSPVRLIVTLDSGKGSARYGINLTVHDGHDDVWTDVPAQGSSQAEIGWLPPGRGHHAVPVIRLETRYPLGMFRVWAIWRPAASVWVYPQPEHNPPPMPVGQAHDGKGVAITRPSEGYDGLRPYRRGDPLKSVAWKRVAQAMARGSSDLVSRDTSPTRQSHRLWLDGALTGLQEPEARLSRLTAWVLAADRQGQSYGLRINGRVLPVGQGPAHRQQCLEALALC